MVTLGIDFGTSSTVAVLRLDDGRTVPLLFGETPLLPSAVCVGAAGELIVGRDAVQASRSRPEAFEPNPKARLDDGEVLLGERVVPVVELVGAVLRRVHDEAVRVAGGPVGRVFLTHPASWDARRRQPLLQAAALAGLPLPTLVAEPVAAAAYYVHVLGHVVPPGGCLVVYDFGAGTFDASVVRRTAMGFEVLAEQGIPDAGGLDVDAAIVVEIGAIYRASDPDGWQRLAEPATPADRRLTQTFWDDVRIGKEALSRAVTTTVFVPILEVDAAIGREELDALARPLVERTIAATLLALGNAGVGPAQIAAVVLVGGSSRMGLPGVMLQQALGIAPTVIEQPELIVAGGTLHLDGTQQTPSAVPPAAVPHPAPPPALPHAAPLAPAPPSMLPPYAFPPAAAAPAGRTGLVAAVVVAAVLLVVVLVAGVVLGVRYLGGDGDPADGGAAGAASCVLPADSAFPPLAKSFDKRLRDRPAITAGTEPVDGLVKKVLIEGRCAEVKPTQTVTVNYVGATLTDGKIFDASWDARKTFDTHVGMRQRGKQMEVIDGWDTGLVGVKVGSRVQLDFPPRMAYGDSPPQGAPIGALRFIVDVLAARD